MTYDSTADTLVHIEVVRSHLTDIVMELLRRGAVHDKSKLKEPEKTAFDRETPLLKTLEYGSEEYKASLSRMKPAIEHHYRMNSHHPEHYGNGIDGMDLCDLVEMYCDWMAAAKRSKDGDFLKGLEHNKERFDMSPQLVQIFRNTYYRMEERVKL